jgi:hypothetical protein
MTVEFDDSMFKPANERQPGDKVTADEGGNARPMSDLADVSHHNDHFGDELQYPGKPGVGGPGGSGRGPSQDEPSKGQPKPSLVGEPNYWGEMAPNTGSHPASGKAPGDVARRRAGIIRPGEDLGVDSGALVQEGTIVEIPNPPGPTKNPATELAGPEVLEE